MARARNIKPGFYTNEDLAECSVWARYIFPGLWMMADREGRLEYRPKKIKGELLRYDNQDAEPLLKELAKFGFIEIYEVEGREFIQIATFSKHQNPHHREAESTLPPPPSLGLSMDASPGKPEAHPSEALGSCGMEGGYSRADSGFSDSLIPDSLIPDSGSPSEEQSVVHATAREEIPHGSSPVSRAVEIATYLRQRGVAGANSFNPNVAAWADDVRVTNEILEAALSKARTSLGNKPAGVNYLAPVIVDLLNPAPAKPQKPERDDWFRSPKGIERKASELGIYARAGETHDALRERCDSELRRRAQGVAA